MKLENVRLMLHAWRPAFNHPVTGKRLRFEAPVPLEYASWLQLLNTGLSTG